MTCWTRMTFLAVDSDPEFFDTEQRRKVLASSSVPGTRILKHIRRPTSAYFHLEFVLQKIYSSRLPSFARGRKNARKHSTTTLWIQFGLRKFGTVSVDKVRHVLTNECDCDFEYSAVVFLRQLNPLSPDLNSTRLQRSDKM